MRTSTQPATAKAIPHESLGNHTSHLVCGLDLARYLKCALHLKYLSMHKKNNTLEMPWADIVRGAAKTISNESERAQKIDTAILAIDDAIKSNSKDQLICINVDICSKFPEIVFASGSGIIRVTREFMEPQTIDKHIESLRAIGKVLYQAKLIEKIVQVAKESGKVALDNVMQNAITAVLGMRDGDEECF